MFDLVPFGEVIAFGLGVVGLSAAMMTQCADKRNAPKKAKKKGGAGVKSKKSVRTSKKSQRSQLGSASGAVNSKKSQRSQRDKPASAKSKRSSRSQKKQRASSRSSSKKSLGNKKSASAAVASQTKKSKAQKRSVLQPGTPDLPIKEMSLKSLQETQAADKSVVNTGIPEASARSTKREKELSLKSLQETQRSEAQQLASQKQTQQLEVSQGGNVPKIEMEPRELHFNQEGGLLKVQLHNPSNVKQAVKIKCSDNSLFRVNPVYGVVQPGEHLNVEVVRQNGNSKLDKLVFVTAKATGETGDLKKLFKETPREQQEMTILPLFA